MPSTSKRLDLENIAVHLLHHLMHSKRGNPSSVSRFASDVQILMAGFVIMCIINMFYFNRTSVALLELEKAFILARNRDKVPDFFVQHVASAFDLRNLSNASAKSISNNSNLSKTIESSVLLTDVHIRFAHVNTLHLAPAIDLRNQSHDKVVSDLHKADSAKKIEPFIFPTNVQTIFPAKRSKSASVSPIFSDGPPTAPEVQITDPNKPAHRKWTMKRWKFELSSTNTIVLEQISPEDAVPYGRHYTESVRNRSRPLRPGTAAVSDAASLAALSPADFASIKRIWIWGRPLAARSMLRAFPCPPSSTAACPELMRASAFALAPSPGGDEKRTAHPRPRSRPRAPPVFVCLRHWTACPRPAAGRRPTGPRR